MPQRKSPSSLRVISQEERADDLYPPDWMSEGALDEWLIVTPKLKRSGVLAQTDEMALAVYCELASEFKENPVEFPAAKLTQLRLVMSDFGMTPHSRAGVAGNEKSKGNRFAGNGKRGS